MGSLHTHKNIHAPLTPCKPEGADGHKAEKEKEASLGFWGLGLRRLGKDAASGSFTC